MNLSSLREAPRGSGKAFWHLSSTPHACKALTSALNPLSVRPESCLSPKSTAPGMIRPRDGGTEILLGDGELAQPVLPGHCASTPPSLPKPLSPTKVCGQVRAVKNSCCLRKFLMLEEPSFLSVCHIYWLMLYLIQGWPELERKCPPLLPAALGLHRAR